MIERFNRTVQQMLAMFVNDNHEDWDDHLPYVMMAYRSTVHDSTGCTPYKLMFGREVSLPIDVMVGNPVEENSDFSPCLVEYVEWLRSTVQNSFEFARENLQNSSRRQKSYYDAKCVLNKFCKGSFVYRWYPPTANQKLGLGWQGPYLVLSKMTDYLYRIQKEPNSRIIVVHVDHLKKCSAEGLTPWDAAPQIEDENPLGDVSASQEDGSSVEDARVGQADQSTDGSGRRSLKEENERGTKMDAPCTPRQDVKDRRGRVIRKPARYLD